MTETQTKKKKTTTVELDTVKFGKVEIEKKSIFNFITPIIGFNGLKKYAIIDYKPDSPFKWLQSVEDIELAFPITLCSFFGIDYQFDVPDEEAEKLGIQTADDVFVINIANIPSSNPQGATINMLAPIIINLSNRKAMQIVLKNTEFEVRHKLFEQEDQG